MTRSREEEVVSPDAVSELGDPCPPKTRSDLEWDRVLEALSERCSSGIGRRAARALSFLSSHEEIARALSEAREAFDFEMAGDPLVLGALPEAEEAIERARIGSVLGNEELRNVVACLGAARFLRKFLHSRRLRAPLLDASCAFDPTLDELEAELGGAFDPDGTLSDRASPKLAELRAEHRATRQRLVRRLEELMRKHEDVLQDAYFTERDGRYVLPLRADAHERFPCIVHAASASGATLFVEPRVLVESGNRLKMLDGQVLREEHAVYMALSVRLAESVESVAAALRALAHADVRSAAAKLARDLRLTFPTVSRNSPAAFHLRDARHPLLLLDGVVVVGSDLAVDGGHAMVISGPNAGGKTVALKTLGLAALMVRAGLPVPAGEGSEVCAFDRVLSDVGDDQNLRENLSTFSAHVKNMAAIVDESRPGALVLLDELAGGTDPREGEALAAALLDSLCARGAAIACTTHYEGLKALALGDSRFANASVGFDAATMSPTFRVALGIPGASSALSVARRFGIPSTVLERAERFMTREALTFDEMVKKLADERRALEIARYAAEREAELLRGKQDELAEEIARASARERATITREGEALLEALKRAREELRAAQNRLRAARTSEEDVRAAARAIEAVARKTALGGELEPKSPSNMDDRRRLPPQELRVGLRVYVPKLRAEADVVDLLPGGMVRVAAGPLKLTAQADDLRAAAVPKASAPKSGPSRPGEAAPLSDFPLQTRENTLDLRGLRAHEAASMTEQFLDRSLLHRPAVAFLIHGHGSGALRDAVRDVVRQNPFVRRSRGGAASEGGDGVTVVWLEE